AILDYFQSGSATGKNQEGVLEDIHDDL
ncbi:PTS N-acetylgalactosamine transporter subunit IIC, partial [Salmonella enterica]|nr:PTS N-acetylgalactosamine transporter subunit IIC [Salmonella enterica]